jgi:hypothetical protein
VVDIDHPQQVLSNEFGAQNLHVACQHNQVNVLSDQLQHFLLGFTLVLWIAQPMKRNSVEFGKRLGRGMIADDPDYLASQFAGATPVEEVS